MWIAPDVSLPVIAVPSLRVRLIDPPATALSTATSVKVTRCPALTPAPVMVALWLTGSEEAESVRVERKLVPEPSSR
jgi:uncharacterized membrane protein YadS